MRTTTFETKLFIDEKVYHFAFYGFNTVNGKIFLIATNDDDVQTVFHMIFSNRKKKWIVSGEAPRWIIKIQDQLSDIIMKQSA